MSGKIEPILLVHGGAGDIHRSIASQKLDGVRIAVRLGYEQFKETGSIIEAAIKAITLLEEDESFNAGKGSVLTEDGVIEMEACVMDGKLLKAGAVACLRNVANPIKVARLVMDKTPHVLLTGKAAKTFATKHGVANSEDSNLFTKAARDALSEYHYEGAKPTKSEVGIKTIKSSVGGTVGVIGIDANGNVIACSSSGGITGKMTGRIGDAAIPGAGAYADNKVGTVAVTGSADNGLCYGLTFHIMSAMGQGKTAQEAAEEGLKGLQKALKQTAGAIVLSKQGEVGIYFTTHQMAWAYFKGKKVHFGIEQGDFCEEDA